MKADDSLGAGDIALVVCASISLFFSLFLILTYCIDSQWRNEFRRVKRILLALSICTLVDASASMDTSPNKSSTSCALQANATQVGIVSAFLYEACMSWEMATTTLLMREGLHAQDKRELQRHVIYHCVVLLVDAIMLAVVNSYNLIEQTNFHCHYSFGLAQLCLLIPAAFSLIVVIIGNMYSWQNILCMMRALMPDVDGNNNALVIMPATGGDRGPRSTVGSGSKTSGASAPSQLTFRDCYVTFQRADRFTQHTVLRIMFTPALYVAVYVICAAIYVIYPKQVGSLIVLAAVLVLPAINTTLWVVSDKRVRQRWRNLVVWGEYTESPSLLKGPDDSDRESDVEALYASQLKNARGSLGPKYLWNALFGGSGGNSSARFVSTSRTPSANSTGPGLVDLTRSLNSMSGFDTGDTPSKGPTNNPTHNVMNNTNSSSGPHATPGSRNSSFMGDSPYETRYSSRRRESHADGSEIISVDA